MRFTIEEAVQLLERAGKAEVAASERELSVSDVLDLARCVGIDPGFVEREFLRDQEPVRPEALRDRQLESVGTRGSRLRMYRDSDYLMIAADPAGLSAPVVARLIMWASVLGFVTYFGIHSGFTMVSVCATLPFLVWASFSTWRLVRFAMERTSVVLSRKAFSARSAGALSRRELTGNTADLQVDEPRIARDPEGGLEVFPWYFLRLRSGDRELDILHGQREADVRRAYGIVQGWRKDVAG